MDVTTLIEKLLTFPMEMEVFMESNEEDEDQNEIGEVKIWNEKYLLLRQKDWHG